MESFPNFYFLEVFDLMLTLKLLLLKHGFLSPSSSHVNYNNSLGSILSSWSYDTPVRYADISNPDSRESEEAES